jgi:hypothetical protein
VSHVEIGETIEVYTIEPVEDPFRVDPVEEPSSAPIEVETPELVPA